MRLFKALVRNTFGVFKRAFFLGSQNEQKSVESQIRTLKSKSNLNLSKQKLAKQIKIQIPS